MAARHIHRLSSPALLNDPIRGAPIISHWPSQAQMKNGIEDRARSITVINGYSILPQIISNLGRWCQISGNFSRQLEVFGAD